MFYFVFVLFVVLFAYLIVARNKIQCMYSKERKKKRKRERKRKEKERKKEKKNGLMGKMDIKFSNKGVFGFGRTVS